MQIQPSLAVFEDEPVLGQFGVRLRNFHVLDDSPVVSLHYHDTTELGICHSGAGVFHVGKKVLPFGAGDVSIIAPGEMHRAESLRGTKSRWTFIFVDLNGILYARFPELREFDIAAYSGDTFRNIVSPEENPDFAAAIAAVIAEMRHQRPMYQAGVLVHLASIALSLRRHNPFPMHAAGATAVGRSLDPLKGSLEFIGKNYHRKIRVTELASLCNMSPRNFTRRFTRALHRSPLQYLTDTRIAMACSQLVARDSPIALVAEENGFPTVSSFNRAFKRATGVSPQRWRAQRMHARA